MQELDQTNLTLDKGNGYLYVFNPRHECANSAGKVYIHRYHAALKIGRPLD